MTRKTPYRLAIALALVLMVAMGSQRVVEVEAHAGDSFALDKANYSMTEGETLIVRIDRTVVSPPADSHVVTLAVDSGTAVRFSHFGFNSAPPDLKFSFGPIDTNRTLEIFAVDDGDPNADRQFTIRIASVTNSGAFESTASVVTIRDNDTPRAAQVTGISPESGNTGGGTEVTISGFDFTGTNCTGPDLGVAFGAVEATSCQVISDTTIKAIAPSQDAGGVSIRVTNDDGLGPSPDTADDNFEYVAGPAISGVMPSSGTEGGVAQIRGTGLGPNPTVTFGSAVATISGSPTSTQINVIIPAPPAGTLPIPVRVKVTVSGVDSPDTGADDFTYAAVTVTGLSPSTGPEGTAVVITGTGFTTTSTVKFGTVTADVVGTPTPTSITAVAPVPLSTQRPHTVDVSVTSGDVVSANTGADNFQYVGVTLTSLTPVAGPPGTVVTIAGSGFRGTPIVKFGTTTATTVTEVSDTSLKVVAPPHAAGKVDVTVQSGDVVAPTPTDTTKDDFTYTAGVEVTEVSPKKGPTAGGNTVTITGSGFAPTGGATVTVLFGTTPGTVVTVTSNTQLTVTAPARGAGTSSVTVTVNGVSNPDTDGDDSTY
ncbi:MAG: IPT/TIG domain-containing protein, partial [Dehalococcoidia bacterium]